MLQPPSGSPSSPNDGLSSGTSLTRRTGGKRLGCSPPCLSSLPVRRKLRLVHPVPGIWAERGNIAVLGAARYGLMTIGIADEEAAIITIMATKDKADEYAKESFADQK